MAHDVIGTRSERLSMTHVLSPLMVTSLGNPDVMSSWQLYALQVVAPIATQGAPATR